MKNVKDKLSVKLEWRLSNAEAALAAQSVAWNGLRHLISKDLAA